MLLVKKPFCKKGAIPWEAIQECFGLHEDQPAAQSEDAEAGKSGVVQEGQEAQGGWPHSMEKVETEVTVGKKWKAMLDEPGPETNNTQQDEPALEVMIHSGNRRHQRCWKLKLKPKKKTGRIIKSRKIISDS